MRRLFLRFGAAGDSDGQFVASSHVCAAPAPKPDVCAQPGEGGSRAGTQTAQQSRHQTRVGPVPGISRQQSHARVSPVWCTWGGDTAEVSLKGLNLGGKQFWGEPRRGGGSSHGLQGVVWSCPPPSLRQWGRAGGRREWGSAQGHGVLPHPTCERFWNGCVVVEGQESPPGAALPTRGLLQWCSHPGLRPHLRRKGGYGNSMICCHDSPEHGPLPVPCPP